MTQFRTMNKKIIEIFDEKIGSVIRTICFRSLKESNEFVKVFTEMRYPGYGLSYNDNWNNKWENNLVNHHNKT